MPLRNEDIIDVVQQLSTEKNIQVMVTQCAKGALMSGGCAFAGGILGGPIGIGIGGTLGSLAAALFARNTYKSLFEIIMYDMSENQKERLAVSVRNIIRDVNAQDGMLLLAMLLKNGSLQSLVLQQVATFVKTEMGLTVQY